MPVLDATNNLEILSLILKILCESWLDHIYMKKIKFSRSGAINLLTDFDGVSIWITSCKSVQSNHTELLAKHEVLRMCEGVGKILLRKPEEVISMIPSPRFNKIDIGMCVCICNIIFRVEPAISNDEILPLHFTILYF